MKYTHSCLLLASLGSLSSLALAQDVEGAIQLGLGTGFITYSKNSGEVETPLTDIDVDTSRTTWGLHDRSPLMLEGGYGLTDSLVLGGLLVLGGNSESIDVEGTDEETDSTFNLLLAPKVDYLFMPSSKLRPFVGGALGLAVQNTDSSSADTETSLWGLGLLGRVGLKWFPVPGFSIDIGLQHRRAVALGRNGRRHCRLRHQLLGLHDWAVPRTVGLDQVSSTDVQPLRV